MHIAQSKRPDLPFFDWNACPFEGCVYRQWTARASVTVYNTWKRNRREAAHLSTGDSVLAVTGVVITYRPGIIRMNHDMPEQGLQRGNLIYMYSYRGEGSWLVWFNGRFREDLGVPYTALAHRQDCAEDCIAIEVQEGKREWWAKVKMKSGKTAWVNMDKEFENLDGVDALS